LNGFVGEKVTLILDHDPDPAAITADKRQLEQVMMNLVVNVRDAMPQGGDFGIKTENRVLEGPLSRDRVTVPAGEYVCVRLVDEGCGIPADRLDKIFEPFWTTKRPGEGTG
jgi:two-component system cell cycle sensor histidine kinase/response regulator CckA